MFSCSPRGMSNVQGIPRMKMRCYYYSEHSIMVTNPLTIRFFSFLFVSMPREIFYFVSKLQCCVFKETMWFLWLVCFFNTRRRFHFYSLANDVLWNVCDFVVCRLTYVTVSWLRSSVDQAGNCTPVAVFLLADFEFLNATRVSVL